MFTGRAINVEIDIANLERLMTERVLPYSLIFRLCGKDFRNCRNKARFPCPPMASFILEARFS